MHLGWCSTRPLARAGPRAPQRFRLDRPPSPMAWSPRSDPVADSCRPRGCPRAAQPKSEFLSAHPYHHHLTLISHLITLGRRSLGPGFGRNPRSHAVRPYLRRVGGNVAPHRRSNPNREWGATGPPIRTPTPTPDGKGLGSLRRNAGEQADHWRAHLFAVCRGKV